MHFLQRIIAWSPTFRILRWRSKETEPTTAPRSGASTIVRLTQYVWASTVTVSFNGLLLLSRISWPSTRAFKDKSGVINTISKDATMVPRAPITLTKYFHEYFVLHRQMCGRQAELRAIHLQQSLRAQPGDARLQADAILFFYS